MAIRITEDGVVNYENNPDVNRKLFPNLNVCGKEIDKLEEEINGKAPAVFSTTSGSIASFDNAADDMPLKSCVVSFEPIQEGEGDPSPENVRPISGRTGVSVVRCGKNLLPNNAFTSVTKQGLTYTVNEDGSVSVSGTATTSSYLYCTASFPVDVIINGIPENNNNVIEGTSIEIYSTEVGVGGYVRSNDTTLVIPANKEVAVRLRVANGTTLTSALFKPMARIATDSDYSFESYNGSTYSVNWETEAGTVYGGRLDLVSGKLIVDRGYIASYNGETLPSTWISDRDVYSAGTMPTTGAQVVYELATPTEIQLTPQEVRTLLGVNNIWSDAGDVSVDYPADTKTYIDGLSIKTVEVTGQTPTITAEENTRYICGEVTSLSFTPCEKGICDVRFTAASISTVLTLPETVKLPEWFDPALLAANTTYEINVLDGIYGVVMSWV